MRRRRPRPGPRQRRPRVQPHALLRVPAASGAGCWPALQTGAVPGDTREAPAGLTLGERMRTRAGGREAPAGPLGAWPSRRSRLACSQKAQLAPWTQLSAWPLSCRSVGGRHVRYAVRGTSTPGTWQRPQSPAARDPTVARGPPLCAALGQTAAWAGPVPASPPGRPQCHNLPPDSRPAWRLGGPLGPRHRRQGSRGPGRPAPPWPPARPCGAHVPGLSRLTRPSRDVLARPGAQIWWPDEVQIHPLTCEEHRNTALLFFIF